MLRDLLLVPLACMALAGEAGSPRPTAFDHLPLINAVAGWDIQPDAGEVLIGIADDGGRLSHELLRDHLWRNPGEDGRDAQGRDKAGNGVDDDGNGYVDDVHGIDARRRSGRVPSGGHGTIVAGCVMTVARKARLVFAAANGGLVGEQDPRAIARGLDYCRLAGAKVINCSWFLRDDAPVVAEALQRCAQAGIIVVFSSGNFGNDIDAYPQRPISYQCDTMIVVTGTDQRGRRAHFNVGAASVHLAAPGMRIRSAAARRDDAYDRSDGTSEAAPQVAAAVAMLIARHPGEDAQSIINRLLHGTVRETTLVGACQTAGRLDLAAALSGTAITPPNNRFAERSDVGTAAVALGGRTWHAEREPGLPADLPGPAIWWSWTCPDDGEVSMDWDGGATVGVYTGEALASLVRVAGRSGGGLRFAGRRGAVYQIAASTGGSGARVHVRLGLPPPGNDHAAGAIDLGDAPSTAIDAVTSWARPLVDSDPAVGFDAPLTAAMTAAMRREGAGWRGAGRLGSTAMEFYMEFPPAGRRRWWSWLAPRDGTLHIAAEDLGWMPTLTVFTGPRAPEGEPVAGTATVPASAPAADRLRLQTPVLAGRRYWLAIAGAARQTMAYYDRAGQLQRDGGEGAIDFGQVRLSLRLEDR